MENTQPPELALLTAEKLRTSIRVKGPLPGLASAVRLIEIAASADNSGDEDIVNAVLGDPSLIQKVLRLANSSMYSAFGGYVDTVSRALVILGTNTVAHLAFSQKLLNNLRPSDTSGASGSAMDAATLAGHIGRQFAKDLRGREVETVVICSLMQSMGRLLLEFYLPEDYRGVTQAAVLTGETEDEAARRLLGLPVNALSLEVAREWRMPQTILAGLQYVTLTEGIEHSPGTSRVAILSTLAHLCATALAHDSGAPVESRLLALTARYAEALGLSAETLMLDLDEAISQADAERVQAGGQPLSSPRKPLTKPPMRPLDFLAKGIAGICLRREGLTAGQAVWATAEYLFSGLGLNRALVVVRKGAENDVRAGLGPDAPTAFPALRFDDKDAGGLVRQALMRNKAALLEQPSAVQSSSELPRGWSQRLGVTGTALVIPIVIRNRLLGLIYGDWTKDDPNSVLRPSDLRALENFRRALVAVISGQQLPHPRVRVARASQLRPLTDTDPVRT